MMTHCPLIDRVDPNIPKPCEKTLCMFHFKKERELNCGLFATFRQHLIKIEKGETAE
jgi:hypothetical protein